MSGTESKRIVDGSMVWEIRRTYMDLSQWASSWPRGEKEELLQHEETERFIQELMEFVSPHLSRNRQMQLLEILVNEIINFWAGMSYTERLRPTAEKLVKFLDEQKKEFNNYQTPSKKEHNDDES